MEWTCATCGAETDEPETVTSDCQTADHIHDWHATN